ncbi:MAG TPA: hypothetical protein VHJ82_08080, partial [Actinomycetota bacterium]|nr:hypothetical protein [Actinomycetota bacterium]
MREDLQAVVERVRSLAAVDLAGIITPDRLLAPGPDDEAQAWAVIARRLDDVRREEVNSGNEIDEATVDQIAQRVFDELLRLGPLQRHLADPEVEEVMVNGFGTAFAIRSGGRKERIATGFANEAELQAFVSRTVAATGRRLDQASPA